MTQVTKQSIEIMARLRAETRPAHDSTEALPFGIAMLAQELPRQAYVAQLQSYVHVHDALESSLDSHEHPTIDAIWSEERAKLQLLHEDLKHLDTDQHSLSEETSQATQEMVAFVNQVSDTHAVSLLGVLYVLEGSTLGGQILRKHVTSMYELSDGQGVAYYTAYGEETGRYWHRFRSQMNELITDPTEQDAVVEAAITTFNHIQNILITLHD